MALFVGLPFWKVGDESALRFDVPTLRLHFFGASLWMDEFFLVLLVLLFATFLFISVTLLFGRIWCGWLCPQIVFVDVTASAGKRGKGLSGGASQAAVLFVSVIVGAVTVWYFVSPYDFLQDLAAGELGKVTAGSWIVLSAVTWLDLALVRQTFCATVCPYSRFQGVLLDRDSLVIAFDKTRAGECIDCGACVKTCPVEIDIRDGLQAACVNCAECVDACARILERKGTSSLVGYFFGAPGGKFRPWRPASLAAGAVALAFLGAILLVSLNRESIALTVLPNPGIQARRSDTGKIVATYVLSLSNRGREDAALSIAAEGPSGPVDVSPSLVEVRGGERRRLIILVTAEREGRIVIILSEGKVEFARGEAAVALPD
jgi:cytochrome c oxidase accessory protein FixG